MRTIIRKIKYYFDIAKQKGFTYIVVSSLLNKVIVLASTITLNRLLSQTDYGYFSYAYNIVSMVMVISSLGVDVSLLQFCCENRSDAEKASLGKYALIFGLVSNLLFSLFTLIGSRLVNTKLPEAMVSLSYLSFIFPLPFLVSFCSMILRSRLDNKKYAILTNISSIAYLGFLIILTIPFGLNGAILGRYLGFFIPAIFGSAFLGKYKEVILKAGKLEQTVKKAFLTYGITVTLTNSVSSLLYYIDIYVVGRVTSDAISIASYKTATIIPNALAALPTIIVTFIYPYFAKNKDNRKWIIKNARIIQLFTFGASVLIAIVLHFLAPQIINLVFGEQYLDAVAPFRILLIGFVISGPFRVISGNIIAMLGRVKANFYIGLASCILNIVLDYYFIKKWGSVGAAFATTIIMLFAALLSNTYLYYVYGNKKRIS